jgi:hypothetical protein
MSSASNESSQSSDGFVFPKWTNLMRYVLLLALVGGPAYLGILVGTAASPRTTDAGYQPEQPVPYSHALHAGELGMDCRYCHTSVENAAFAALPTSQTCMNCHATILPESPKLEAVRESYRTGMPIRWVKVHDLPDYVFFNHSAHVTRGVACVECHGRVDEMEVVRQVQPLSMSWCLDCHRNPDARLRPAQFATRMDWKPSGAPGESGREIRVQKDIKPSEDCVTCHR